MKYECYFKTLTGLVWGVGVCFLLWMVCGCATRKPLVLTVTDTVRVERHITDTVFRDRTVTKAVQSATSERTSRRDSTSTTVDEQGNVRRTDSWHWLSSEKETRMMEMLRDSLGIYKAKADTLTAVASRNRDVPVPVERKLSWWEKNITKPIQDVVATCMWMAGIIGTVWLISLIARRVRSNTKTREHDNRQG